MKTSHKVFVGIATTLSLALAGAAAYAQPEGMDAHMQGMHGAAAGKGAAGPMAGGQLMTAEERAALMEKMHNAKTPEERHKLAQATHAEMQKRAKDKGVTMPQHHVPHMGRTGTPAADSETHAH